MVKTIRKYEIETREGVARFFFQYPIIREMACDHRVDAKDAIFDMKATAENAGLNTAERFALMKAAAGNILERREKAAFFNACEKIAAVFREQQYGDMEITRFC